MKKTDLVTIKELRAMFWRDHPELVDDRAGRSAEISAAWNALIEQVTADRWISEETAATATLNP